MSGAQAPAAASARELETFRAEARAWFQENAPRDWRESMRDATPAEFIAAQRKWLLALNERGYAIAHWPAEWGGGFSLEQQVVLHEEAARADAPYLRVFSLSLYHAATTLLHGASPEQQREHLPRIRAGEEIWCQGFSEPEAGSDLAALKTRAVRDGDRYVVNGQKVWTSLGDHADWCLLLARTDPAAAKHRGISFFMLDLRTPGIEFRPIRKATGHADFCELFLTDVEIPAANRLGEENTGWKLAQSTLSAERGLVSVELAERLWAAVQELLREAERRQAGSGLHPALRERIVDAYSEARILRGLCRRMVSSLVSSGGVGPEASVIKLFYSELLKRLSETGARLQGLSGLRGASDPLGAGWHSYVWMLDFIGSWAWTIAGGTNEIQRTLVGERVLGLPRDPGRS